MRILFASYAEKNHFLSMVPLAWALRTGGHEVRAASQPALVDVIADTGLTVVPVGKDHMLGRLMAPNGTTSDGTTPDGTTLDGTTLDGTAVLEAEPGFDLAERDLERFTWDYLTTGYSQFVPWWWKVVNEPMIDDLTALCRQWRPDLVIWEPTTYAAPIAAAAVGAAHARFLWSHDLLGRMRARFLRLLSQRPADSRQDILAEWLDARMRPLGGAFSEEMTTGHFTVDPFPASLRIDTGADLHHVPVRHIPYSGRAVVPHWLRGDAERRRVCLTVETTLTERFGRSAVPVREILDSLADLDLEIVASMPPAEQEKLGHVPDNVRVMNGAPLHALMPTCSALINHGGAGAALTAAGYGVPQLVVPHPQMFDEPLTAERIADLGAGLALPCRDATGDHVRENLLRLLDDPAYAKGAGQLREEMAAMPTPNGVVAEIERLVAEYRP
ncbi:glycosyltransferase, activator-dependent family [Sinosporangium album]|uniref:Glycosyltransferase, activator-dependent family n=1 Tax=Sinosporangium album TaxID=504805 RepID=A0A1G7ZDA5_9ACTN|nr:activator-dependent family glycosyltransferase [Sinosporangium album]SDH06629.1 glycosyltransferase, activator-dependent family [Sinosporangium album]